MGRTACIEPQCLYKRALYLTFYQLFRCASGSICLRTVMYEEYVYHRVNCINVFMFTVRRIFNDILWYSTSCTVSFVSHKILCNLTH